MMKRHVSSFEYIVKVEKENIRKTKVLMKEEIKLYKDSFNLFAEVLDELYPHPIREAKSITEMAVLPILSKIAMLLKSYFNLVIMGYYHEAIVLHRNILESVLLCMLVAEKPKYAMKWLKDKIEPSEVKKELGLESVADVYGMMSGYAHLNIRSFGTFLEIKMEKQRGLMIAGWTPRFNEENARILLVPALGPTLISYLSHSYKERLSANLLKKMSRHMKEIQKTWEHIMTVSQP